MFIAKFKRELFKKLVRDVEQLGVDKKRWGGNIQTLHCTTMLINNNLNLFEPRAFVEYTRMVELDSAFDNMEAAIKWLEDSIQLVRIFSQKEVQTFPDAYQGLVISRTKMVRLTTFLSQDGENLQKRVILYLDELQRLTTQLFEGIGELKPMFRNLINLRLGNGFKTLLMINELILEVMINDRREQISRANEA